MYRHEIYLRKFQTQLKKIMQMDMGTLTISSLNNPFYNPAKIMTGFGHSLAAQLMAKTDKSISDYVYLLVALKLNDQSYHPQLSQFKKAYPDRDQSQSVNKLVDYLQKNKHVPEPKESKEKLRRKYEQLLGKAQAEGYFRIPEVPVYLVCTNWLQKFYSSDLSQPGPVNNQILLETAKFPLAEFNFLHYNYQVRSDVRQNDDFKIIPYEAWNLLRDNYGGVEIKRFTTKEKKPTVEIWFMRTKMWVVEERSVQGNFELLISKNETIDQILARLRLTLKNYQVLPDKYLARKTTVFKINGLEIDQFSALLHNEEKSHLLTQKMQKIKDFDIEFDDTSILSNREGFVINYWKSSASVFDNVPALKILRLKERCLKCDTTDGLELCKCRTVYFCSKACRQAKKDHFKECSSLQGQARKYSNVTQYYDVSKRSFPKLQEIIPIGKVGFENIGNTCYMNSALQCVLRIEPIVTFFLRNGHLQDLNVGNVLGSQGYLACAFGELVKDFYTTSRRSLEPSAVLRVIAKNPQFRGYNHQDSQQFLNYFLDKLHEDLNKVREKPYTEEIESNGRPDEVVSQLSWDNYGKRNQSVMVDNLAGQYRSQISCPDCNRLSITFDPFLSLTLQFPRPDKGIEFQGHIMNEDGDFQKMKVEVRSSMPTYEFYQKYFHVRPHVVYQKNKKVASVWDVNKTVFQNIQSSGLIFAFEKPMGHGVQINLKINSPGLTDPQNFLRIIFAKDVLGAEQLLRLIYFSIRKPLQKALGKDYNSEDYISLCKDLDFIAIRSITGIERENIYPITGSVLIDVNIQLDQSKLKLKTILKLNVGGTKYEPKSDQLIRKVSKSINMQELLSCFSEPERLTQENAWYCNVCKDHKLAEKAMQLYRTPKYLIVHLKRFNHRGDSGNRFIIYGEKVNTPIDLEQFEVIRGKRYELIGIVNHVGGLMHGHYTSIVKRGDWFNYDDSRCSRTRLDGSNAYLLFYQLAE